MHDARIITGIYTHFLPIHCMSQLEGSVSRHSCAEDRGFSQCDAVPSVLAMQRMTARELHQHQINSATLRRREAQFSRILEQKREINMLNRTRQE